MGVRISLPVQFVNLLTSQHNQPKMNKLSTYFRESYKELMEKVTWPTWVQLQQSTMIVLAATLVITAVVAIMDVVAAGGLKFIYNFI
jgi:preprotein translocase subunit SecE